MKIEDEWRHHATGKDKEARTTWRMESNKNGSQRIFSSFFLGNLQMVWAKLTFSTGRLMSARPAITSPLKVDESVLKQSVQSQK